jgi:ApbE superfamily uncharacterized protein (UPF0280 family)
VGILDKIRPAPLAGMSVEVGDLVLQLQIPETFLDQARAAALRRWEQVEAYLMRNPWFKDADGPLQIDMDAPPIINAMTEASRMVNVRPFATLAGALVEAVAGDLAVACREAVAGCEGVTYIVGGAKVRTHLIDPSGGDGRGVAVKVRSETPYAVYSSAGRVRIIPVTGRARAIAVVGKDGALTESVGVAIGATMRKSSRVEGVLATARQIGGLRGGVVVTSRDIGVWGDIEIVTPASPGA